MTLRLNGDSSGFTEIKAPNAAGDNSITLPTSNGGANQLLQNVGTAGALQYTSAGGGLHYDSSGHLLVGTATPRTNINNGGTGWTPYGQFEFANNGWEGVSIINNNGSGFGGKLTIGTSYGGSVGSNTIGTNTAQNGRLSFQANDGSNFLENAVISAHIDGSPGTNVMPGKLVFATNTGGAAPTPRVEIGSNGALKLLAGCPGIDFSAIQTNASGMTSETLDSYEVGTYTPAFIFATGVNYLSGTFGNYIKIGDLVLANGKIKFDTFTAFPNGYDSITVPFVGTGTGGGDTSTSYWTTVGGASGQVSSTFNFGPLDPPSNLSSSCFTNIFTSGPNACGNANFNNIYVSNSTIKEIRFSVIYRSDG